MEIKDSYNILIADDQRILIDGLKRILKGNPKFKVVATAATGSEALTHIASGAIDIAILDIEYGAANPYPDGVELTRLICDQYPDVRVLILTMYHKEAFISEIMKIGSNRLQHAQSQHKQVNRHNDFGLGFILKNKGEEELLLALEALAEGKNYYGKEVLDTILSSWNKRNVHQRDQRLEEPQVRFTRREKDVLKLIAKGRSGPQIAEELFIANSTVETHRRNLLEKLRPLGVHNSKELISYAIRNGLAD